MPRCKNGTRRNIKTGLCEKHVQSEKTVPKKLIKIKSVKKKPEKIISERKRCENGTRRNTKTGLCEKHVQSEKTVPKKLIKIKSVKKKPEKIISERKRCENGTLKNTKTGLCDKDIISKPKETKEPKKKETKKKEPKKQVVVPIRKEPSMDVVPIRKEPIYKLIIGKPTQYIITTEPNKVNNSQIFKLKYPKCIKHFTLPDKDLHFKFLYLAYPFENKGVLVKRNADTDTSNIETITSFFQNINLKPIDEYKQFIKKNQDFLTENKIITFIMHDASCEKELKITKAKQQITELNKLLKKKCSNLSLSLDYIYNMNGHVSSYSKEIDTLLFCLNHSTKGCISSVEIFLDDEGVIFINSKTKTEFEGKKYNKLVRAATIITAPLLGGKTLNSISLNPISTWLLMDSFNAITTDKFLIEFLYDKDVLPSAEPDQIITKDVFTKELIQEYHDEWGGVNLEIDLTNKANIKNAQDVFDKLLTTSRPSKEIKCR